MLSAARDGQQIQQTEIVESQHVEQTLGRAALFREFKPAVELTLGDTDGRVDRGNAMVPQGGVVALSSEGDLVAKISQAIVHRRGRQHQHAGLHAAFEDLVHKAVVPTVPVAVRRAIPEIMGLVDHDQVVVAPVDVGQIDVAGKAAVARQVGVVQDVIV